MAARITLKAILEDAVIRASRRPGIPVRTTLHNGLRVDVLIVEQDGVSMTHLQLFREDTLPSHAEWQTVLKYWPYARDLNMQYKQLRGRYLQGMWVTPSEPVQREMEI